MTSARRTDTLPIPATSLLGREEEVARVRAMLLRADVRLVTLTGPGGTGKTRLALQVAADVADHFEDGVRFVDLAPLADPDRLAVTIASALGLADTGDRLLDDLKRFVQQRSLLLLLDNFEQILPAATLLPELLAASQGLKILVTSRAALQVRGEHELDVPPLAVPDLDRLASPESLQHHGAVALFVERARAVRADFALTAENARAVATICARLDGLPLALELAAARTRLLSPDAMVERLERRLPLLTGGPRDLPARQRTLRDAIAWSYDLLEPDEQRAFRALSVFVGGFTVDAGCWVLGSGGAVGQHSAQSAQDPTPDALDLVEQLVARSLVRSVGEIAGEPRFGMLETIREFALDRLATHKETAGIRERHLQWCAELVERIAPTVRGPAQSASLNTLEAEHDNIRAAFLWADQTGDRSGLGLRIAGLLGLNLWPIRGYHREGRAWLTRLLAHTPARSSARAQALNALGNLALRQNDYPAAYTNLGEAVEIYRELGDRRGVAATLRHLGVVPHHLGQYDEAQAILEESLAIARELGDLATLGVALRNLADLAQDRHDDARAVPLYEEALAVARRRQVPHDIAYALRGLGNVARARGRYDHAEAHLRASLTLLKPLNDRRCIPVTLEGLACITVGPGWADRSARLLGAAHAMQNLTGAPSPPSAMADYERTVADAREALGPERFEAAWAAGAALSLDEAVDLALAAPPPNTAAHAAATRTSQPSPTEAPPAAARPGIPLTPREQEVVALIAQGLSNRQISEQLTLSVRTVERHIENVYNRLGITGKAGRAIVTAYALRHGLVPGSGC